MSADETAASQRVFRSHAQWLDAQAALPGPEQRPSEASRREFLKLLGASVALAGVAGCTRAPRQPIVPYVLQPTDVVPGVAAHYATAMSLDGYATGLLVESHTGRPTKIEGNPKHPASLGATGALEQASILSLYDPSRLRSVRYGGGPRSFADFDAAFQLGAGSSTNAALGEGLHLLLEPTSSPTTIAQLQRLQERYPRSQLHFHAALSRDQAWAGHALLFGRPLEARLELARADVVLALDADFVSEGPQRLRNAHDFAQRRRVRGPSDSMNRLYVVESALTVTGGMADHRLRVRRSDVAALAQLLLQELLSRQPDLPAALTAQLSSARVNAEHAAWLRVVARDLRAHAGRSVIIVGDGQPAAVHALVQLANHMLGNVGQTLSFAEPVIHEAGGASHGLAPLMAALDARAVDTLCVLGGNPVYTAPADLQLARRVARARQVVYLGPYENESAASATWLLPQAHYLEAWGDARAYDGTLSIVQPLLEPLYGGRTLDEVLALLAGARVAEAHSLVRGRFGAHAGDELDTLWQLALQSGVAPGSAQPAAAVTPSFEGLTRALSQLVPAPPGLELSFARDARVHDGTFTNNAWLLELPDPISKLTWENALLVSPNTATRLGLASDDRVQLTLDGRSVSAPVFVAPGNADDSLTLALGYGRHGAEVLARGLGVNANALRSSAAPYFAVGATLVRAPGKHALASTQLHWALEGRDLVRQATLEAYRRDPRFAKRAGEPTSSLYKLPLLGAEQWGMSIDLNACNGCSACVVACQAENNSPVVGKAGVLMHREMHWLRIDRYYEGSVSEPTLSVQPMLCQHCEKAPCEYVCPVNATEHSPDGLNEQVYNRCVGTRFCSNNCAWKVRRFNWFNYHELATRHAGLDAPALHDMLMNPDVSVRARGVMEKCTYCVQRIREKQIEARTTGQPLVDGAVVTACAQACPSQAIVFGSLTLPGAEVKRLRDDDRDYAVLGELGTEPRTRYLAKLRNPNPELPE